MTKNISIRPESAKFDQSSFFDGNTTLVANTIVWITPDSVSRLFLIKFTNPNTNYVICQGAHHCPVSGAKEYYDMVVTNTEKCDAIFKRIILEELHKAKPVKVMNISAEFQNACVELTKIIHKKLALELKQEPLCDIPFNDDLNLNVMIPCPKDDPIFMVKPSEQKVEV